jgi:uridine kinase
MTKPFIIGITGGSGSGKTTIAEYIKQQFGPDQVSLLSQDSFYKDLSHLNEKEKSSWNFDHPEAIDWEEMKAALEKLSENKPISVPAYDFADHCRKGSAPLKPAKLIILEGHLILASAKIAGMLDLKIYLELDTDILFMRRLQRDLLSRGRTLESIFQQYIETVRPMFFQYVLPSKSAADIIINTETGDESTDNLIKIIASKFELI